MRKEIISESRLREIISEEATRFKKKLTLEAEKKKLLNKLQEMYMEETMMDETMMDETMMDETMMDETMMDEESGVDEAFLGMFKNPEEKAAASAQKASELAQKAPEAIIKGTEVAKKNPSKVKVHNLLPKEQRQKFLMFLGFNPNVKYQVWDAKLNAPDGTTGYFKDSAVTSIGGGGMETGL